MMAHETLDTAMARCMPQAAQGRSNSTFDRWRQREVEFAFFGPHFGNVDVEEAVGLELLIRRIVPLDVRQLADAVALQTAV
jgi:hypothetical protein